MSESTQKRQTLRGRILRESYHTPEAIAKRQASYAITQSQRQELRKRCRQIFEQICPQLMLNHYNWFIAIDADWSLDYRTAGAMSKRGIPNGITQ